MTETVDIRDVAAGVRLAHSARTVAELRDSLEPLGLPWAVVELIVAIAITRDPI